MNGCKPKPPRAIPPDPAAVEEAVDVFWSAKRPVVITGRGARQAGPALVRLLDATGALYLDTQESRGLVPADHPSTAAAVRAAAMTDADVVLLIGRKLDYQVGYGSPAVFPNARFIRIADSAGELIDNRRGQPELLASPHLALDAMVAAAGNRERHRQGLGRRIAPAVIATASPPRDRTKDGHSPARRQNSSAGPFSTPSPPWPMPTISRIADGGDLLSFARTGLAASTYMDAGAFGCLGVGVPFAVAAALAMPDRQVISVNGDGAFGINAMEIDTAVRHGAKVVFIVSNNAAWNIERLDQEMNYGGRVVGTTLRHSDYAALARALGAYGERVEKAAELPDALQRALKNAPALIDVVTSQSVISSDAQKGLGFVPDFQALTAWDDGGKKAARVSGTQSSCTAALRRCFALSSSMWRRSWSKKMRFSPASATKRLPRARPDKGEIGLARQLDAPGREPRARHQDWDSHPHGLDHHLRSEPPGGVEDLVVRGEAMLEHVARDLVDGVVAADILHVDQRPVLLRQHAAVDGARFEIKRWRRVDLVRQRVKPRGAQLSRAEA